MITKKPAPAKASGGLGAAENVAMIKPQIDDDEAPANYYIVEANNGVIGPSM
jgi:hypothetical protein